MSHVEELVFRRFRGAYGPAKSDDIVTYMDEYERALAAWPAEILTPAIDRVIATYKGEWNWPVPGYCTDACKAVAEERHAERARQAPIAQRDRQWPEPSEESKRRVREMVARLTASMQAGKRDESKPTLPSVNRDAWRARYGHSYTSRMLGERDE